MTDKEKTRKEVERLINELIQERGKYYSSDVDDACILELQNVLTYIDSLQEEPVSKQNLSNVERTGKNWKEPVSEELEEACEQLAENARKHKAETSSPFFSQTDYKQGVIDGAKWKVENLWKPADGDDLPEIDREVIVLCKNGRVAFGHRPVKKFIARPIGYGKAEEYEVETYGKGGWNIPDVKFWLDVELPKEIEL